MIDLALAKAHLRAEGSAEDGLIQSYLDAAAAHVEGVTGKLLTRREVVQDAAGFHSSGGAYLSLWWGPNPTGLTIDYLDAAGLAATVVLPRGVRDRIYAPVAGWPTARDYSPVAVTYTAGFAVGAGQTPVPADLVQAQLMLVAHWYSNREAVALGGSAAASPAELPLGVKALCFPFRRVLIG